MRIIELFAGIGAVSKALKNIGIDVEIVDAVEIDKYAIKSFNAIHGTNFEPQDVKTWNKDYKDIDIISHGSPCQDFSIAGKQAGGDLGSGTRSSLMYETIRIVEKIRPKYVVWENVKNLLSKKHKHNFDTYIQMLEQLGYANYYQVLNAKDYGIPQNRERVYTISIRKELDKVYVFPEKEELKLKLKDMLEDKVDEKYIISDKLMSYYDRKIKQGWRKELQLDDKEISSTICNPARNNINDTFVRCKQVGDLYGGNAQPKVLSSKIRKLTPLECWRLMGFSDEDFKKAEQVNSNTQLYKQAGNSIVVKVLEKIFVNLFKGE